MSAPAVEKVGMDEVSMRRDEAAVPPANLTESVRQKQSRLEKRARKSLTRLGLKPVPGVKKLIMRKSKHTLFTIQNPDVYKSPTSDTYIIFGDAKMTEAAAPPQEKPTTSPNYAKIMRDLDGEAGIQEFKQALGEDKTDNAEFAEDDINMIMTQLDCTRAQAIQRLKANNGDMIDALVNALPE